MMGKSDEGHEYHLKDAGLRPVKFNFAVAGEFGQKLQWAAGTIDQYINGAASVQSYVMNEFRGYFSTVFQKNMETCAKDGRALAAALRQAARDIAYLAREAEIENSRRHTLKEFLSHDDSLMDHYWNNAFGGVPQLGSMIAHMAPPEPLRSVPAPGVSEREQDRHPGPPGQASSAIPEVLYAGSSMLNGNSAGVADGAQLRTAKEAFDRVCQYGRLDVGALFSQLDQWNEKNDADVTWLSLVASAFEAAGSSGQRVYLANHTLSEYFESNGTGVYRDSVSVAAVKVTGVDKNTGYLEDPVSAATGAFVNPETDLPHQGAATGLVIERVYDSAQHAAELAGRAEAARPDGVFGPGWASTFDQGLRIGGDSIAWIRADGRQIVFPKGGGACAPWRAEADNLWVGEEPSESYPFHVGAPGAGEDGAPPSCDGRPLWVVADNEGGRWLFDSEGAWIGTCEGPEESVRVVRGRSGRIVRLEHCSGALISVDYDPASGRPTSVRARDGRTTAYSYDADGLLVGAVPGTGIGGRSYEWGADGLMERLIGDGVTLCVNTFDGSGRVLSQVSPSGRTTRFAYLPGGVVEASDREGTRSNTWISDAKGRCVGLVDADGNRQSMAYDRWGNLVMSRSRSGETTCFAYDDRGRQVSRVLPTGARVEQEWDEHDRLVRVCEVSSADGGSSGESRPTTVFEYPRSPAGAPSARVPRRPVRVVDPEGGTTGLRWEGALLREAIDPEGVAIRFDYDDRGNVIRVRDAEDGCWSAEYDHADRLVRATTPMGRETVYAYTSAGLLASVRDPEGAQWSYDYDEWGRMTLAQAPDGGQWEWEYDAAGQVASVRDPLGRMTRYDYDDLGNPARITGPDGAAHAFMFDALSRLRSVTDPLGGMWEYDYDADGDLARAVDPTGRGWIQTGTPASGAVVRAPLAPPDPARGAHAGSERVVFDVWGRPTAASDSSGGLTELDYDACGRIDSVTGDDGTTTLVDRDRAGRVVRSVAMPGGRATTCSYDACGRLSAVTEEDGATTRYRYDADWNLVAVTAPDGESYLSYDGCGRVVRERVPGGGTRSIRYDKCGRVVSVRDTAYGPRRFSYDAAGQLVRAENGLGAVSAYEYDEAGRLVRATAPGGLVAEYAYDKCGRCTRIASSAAGPVGLSYDAAGRIEQRTEPDGNVTRYSYDAEGDMHEVAVNGRVIATLLPPTETGAVRLWDGSDPDRPIIHELSHTPHGRPASYKKTDEDGRVISSTSWDYDQEGLCASRTGANGATVTFQRDPLGRVVGVEHPDLGRAGFVYDAAGRVVESVRDGVSRTWDYDDGYVSAHASDPLDGSAPGRRIRVTRDTWGRVTEIDASGTTIEYTYNPGGQLTALESSSGRRSEWIYDAAGRVTRLERRSPSASDEGAAESTTEYSYDAAGRLKRTLTREADGSAVLAVDYSYDACGRRMLEESSDGGRREYTWDETGSLRRVLHCPADGAPEVVDVHVDALGHPAVVGGAPVDWDITAPLPELLRVGGVDVVGLPDGETMADGPTGPVGGRPCAVLGGSDDIWWRPASPTDPADPFAVPVIGRPSALDGLLPGGVRLAAGGELVVGGLVWMGERLYDPASQMFTAPDPLDAPPGSMWEANPYDYAAGNPVGLSDPLGLNPVTDKDVVATLKAHDRKGWLKNLWSRNTVVAAFYTAAGAGLSYAGFPQVGGVLIDKGTDIFLEQADTGKAGLTINPKDAAIDIAGGNVLKKVGKAVKGTRAGRKLQQVEMRVKGGVDRIGSRTVKRAVTETGTVVWEFGKDGVQAMAMNPVRDIFGRPTKAILPNQRAILAKYARPSKRLEDRFNKRFVRGKHSASTTNPSTVQVPEGYKRAGQGKHFDPDAGRTRRLSAGERVRRRAGEIKRQIDNGEWGRKTRK